VRRPREERPDHEGGDGEDPSDEELSEKEVHCGSFPSGEDLDDDEDDDDRGEEVHIVSFRAALRGGPYLLTRLPVRSKDSLSEYLVCSDRELWYREKVNKPGSFAALPRSPTDNCSACSPFARFVDRG
jgi:hypothetical protein